MSVTLNLAITSLTMLGLKADKLLIKNEIRTKITP